MKWLLLSLALLLAPAHLLADPVSASEAEAYAVAYSRNVLGREGVVSSVDTVRLSGVSVCYRVAWQGGGWTLVAADDVVEPIVGFADEGEFDAADVIPPLRSLLNGVALRIADGGVKSACWETDSIASTNKAENVEIEPLIAVNWNQNGKYWAYCKRDGKQAYVGCVAVAMAQAMSVYQYPARPRGSNAYECDYFGALSVNYDEEDPYDWDAIMTAQESGNDGLECARLLYHVGVSVGMEYSNKGSGVDSDSMHLVAYALKTNFGYSNRLALALKEDSVQQLIPDSEWHDIVLAELTEGRPLIYWGVDTAEESGHCFNVDGYKNDLFHINWGWGGSANGYFALDHEKYYPKYQGAVMAFAPPADDEDPPVSAIANISADLGPAAIYTLCGQRVNASIPRPGFYIAVYKGGGQTTSKKILIR